MVRQCYRQALITLLFLVAPSAVTAQSKYQVAPPVVTQAVRPVAYESADTRTTVYEPTQHSVSSVAATDGPDMDSSVKAGQARSVTQQSEAASGFPSLARGRGESGGSLAGDGASAASPLVTVTSSLVVVLGLFAGLVWLTRKFNKQAADGGQVSKDAVDFLGSYPIDPRNRVCLLRVGVRVIVAAQSSSGMQPLSEITDPEEVQNLIALCKGSSSEDFAKTLAAMQKEKAKPGFLGDEASTASVSGQDGYQDPNAGRKLGRLFASNM